MWALAGKYSAVGIEIAAAVGIGAGAGNYLDGRLGTSPWLLLAGFVVGAGAATQTILRVIRQARRER
ncbi:MAG TPA: AtpZ/AtpI family protein [Myxococcota bacterium]|nr:AtpZ/AtpI family protein [Myxococcota bacterium]